MALPQSLAIQVSSLYRDSGNQHFNKGEYYEALCNYNKSLIAANEQKLKLLMALAYANRSAVYVEVKQYEKSLENIELAKLNGYPADKLQKLEAREKKCHDMIEQQKQQDPDDDPKNFFKLSYPANEKIPFIVNCLEIRKDKKRGRGIFTNQDLKAGDIIAIEEPFFAYVPFSYELCNTCFKQNMLSLIPGDDKRMFCSITCSNLSESNEEFFKGNLFCTINKALSISGGYEELREVYVKPTKHSVFDFDLSNPNDAETKLNMLKCAASLIICKKYSKTDAECVEQIRFAYQVPQIDQLPSRKKEIAMEFLQRHSRIRLHNGFTLKMNNYALPIFLPLINRSCDPNIDTCDAYGHLVAIVNRPLRAGYQLFVANDLNFEIVPKVTRQQMIMERMQYICGCIACVGDYPLFSNLRSIDSNFESPPNSFGTVKETTDELKKNWSYIALNIKNHPSLETSTLISRNRVLLDHLGDIAECPFKKAS